MILLPLALALACSTTAQDCPQGQLCVAAWDTQQKLCPAAGRCQPRPAAVELELSLPIVAGQELACGKGNLVPDTSHNACVGTTRFAFDLIASAFEPPRLIVASADGTAEIRGGCASTDLNEQPQGEDRCNSGWGNYVRVQHDATTYTQYAHLSAILVHSGDKVRRGQPIGIEGNTGAAGAKHLHWSAHRGDAKRGGDSVPMARIRLAGKTVSSAELVCGDWSHQKPITDAMRLRSETQLVPQAAQYGFHAGPTFVPLGPRVCGKGLSALGADTCVALPPTSGGAGIVVFLHGLYAPGGSDEQRRVDEALAQAATERGLALVAPRGRQGLCVWSDEVRASICWPSGRDQVPDLGELASALRTTVEEVAAKLGEGPHPRYLMGFSNGGFFATMLLADAPAGALAGAAILHAGAPPSTFNPQHPVPTILIAAQNDPWQGPKMQALDAQLTKAGWPHSYKVRGGAHALAPDDIRDALDFFARLHRDARAKPSVLKAPGSAPAPPHP